LMHPSNLGKIRCVRALGAGVRALNPDLSVARSWVGAGS
jgi:hypothetical protein